MSVGLHNDTTQKGFVHRQRPTGGRDGGASRSSNGRLDVKFSVPGKPGTGTNPEQLLAAGWSACFIGAMGIAAGKMKVTDPADAAIDAEVDLCPNLSRFLPPQLASTSACRGWSAKSHRP